MADPQFSREFNVVAAACRHGDPALPAVFAAMQWEALDWARIAAIARRHRVEALAADTLSRYGAPIGAPALAQIGGRARAAAVDSLRLARAACELGARLDAAGIDWISIKGPALAQLAYRATAIKTSRDFDILVASQDFEAVAALLADQGYQRVEPGPEIAADQLGAWMRYYKDCG